MNQGVTTSKKKLGIIIGGSGLVGGALVYYFQKKWGYDILAPNSKKLSLREPDDIKEYFQSHQPEFIINAAMVALDSNPKLTFDVNYVGSINLAKVAIALGIPYIFISSAAVLPPGEDLKETDTLPLTANLSNYAKSKLMCELTLEHLRKTEGLDHTVVRLAIVYGKHDHKIQGFHRLFFSIVDQSMPALPTQKGVYHSYTNSKKIPYFVHHILQNRDEFSGQTYHFVDPEPVELSRIILTIRNYLMLKRPMAIYIPLPVATIGIKFLRVILKIINKIGIDARLPPEIMFIDNFYQPQTLSGQKLQDSSFTDPYPERDIFSLIPDLIQYYVTRWEQMNLIPPINKCFFDPEKLSEDFLDEPQKLLASILSKKIEPFSNFEKPT
ncbi:MAG: NAD-dependent epimerase/dehydratase family protein [Desulfobulbaceae bacterium]|uniref:dTDP-4-dehydrorhamnose reductase n=1 Tax=Candidatus Desulfobia pelagia TaxID=2841692 RepID=A0A8J6NDJ1_9BACT|nr:NAD-dependent epimerase/dehydratase family protein [Candidatus Desulfobia pelagia]